MKSVNTQAKNIQTFLLDCPRAKKVLPSSGDGWRPKVFGYMYLLPKIAGLKIALKLNAH